MNSLKDKISPKDLDEKNAKARVTMYIDLDILNLLREEAAVMKIGYQTYLNQVLRDVFSTNKAPSGAITRNIYQEIANLKKDIALIQKK